MNPQTAISQVWTRVAPRFLPFADAATSHLPLSRLLRLSLFQVSVGLATALVFGVLNRVMVVELGMAPSLVALMVALPLLLAPWRAWLGFRSDHHRSWLGWRRVPYLWIGTLLQFGGLAILPFALLVLSGDGPGDVSNGYLGAALGFLMVGAGMHTVQTSGLALAMDLAPPSVRPRVVALLHCLLLVGMIVTGLTFSRLLDPYSPLTLIRVVQGAAVLTLVLNLIALWKQESRDPLVTAPTRDRPDFRTAWRAATSDVRMNRFLLAVGLGTAAFAMQDVLLEPYAGQAFGLPVGATSLLSALAAGGALIAFGYAARALGAGADPCRLSGAGTLLGTAALVLVCLALPFRSVGMLQAGAFFIGAGGGLFAVGTLTLAAGLASRDSNGLVLGAWGAAQASAAGLGIACGGALRDALLLAMQGNQLPQTGIAVSYLAVYLVEILLLFMTLVALGPLVTRVSASIPRSAEPSHRHPRALWPSASLSTAVDDQPRSIAR